MSLRLERHAYKRLVEEDLAWLRKQPPSLERWHIELIIETHLKEFMVKGPTPLKSSEQP